MSRQSVETVTLPVDFAEFDDIIDVRSPGEFAEDHVPGALNLPVLDDRQREEVGTVYRRAPFEARRLGAGYISAAIGAHLATELRDRSKGWRPLLYCWRGGMRSQSFAHVLRSIGWRARILDRGYKAWRKFVMAELERLLSDPLIRFHILAGLTGSGKTRLLHHLEQAGAQVLDLEGLANHRGSLLGAMGPQPSQKRFETLLYDQLRRFDPARPIFIEAESSRVGTNYVPPALWRKFPEAVVTELVLPLPARIKLLLEDYDHFPRKPAVLRGLLEELRKLRGHQRVEEWQTRIDAGDWQGFVASILEHHYDVAYRRPGSSESVYQPPSRRLELRDGSPECFGVAAAQLLSNTEGVVAR